MALCIVILRTRHLRRRLIFQVALALMIFIAVGLWPLAGFLTLYPLLFAIFWLICFLALIFLFLLTLYDMVRTPREILGEAAKEDKKLKDQFLRNQPAAAEDEDDEEIEKEDR